MKCCAECSYKHDPVLLCQMPIPVSDSNEATQDLYGNGCSAGWWCCVRYCSPPLDIQEVCGSSRILTALVLKFAGACWGAVALLTSLPDA